MLAYDGSCKRIEWKPIRSGIDFDYRLLCIVETPSDTEHLLWKVNHLGHLAKLKPETIANGEDFPYATTSFGSSGSIFLVSVKEPPPEDPEHLNIHEQKHHIDVWSTETCSRKLRIQNAHNDVITCAVFGLFDSIIASCSWDHTVKLWHSATGECLHTFPSTSQRNCVISISPDSRHIGVGVYNGLMIWNLRTNELEHTLGYDTIGWVRSIAWSPDGQQIAFGGSDGALSVYKTSSWHIEQKWGLEGQQIAVQDLMWMETGRKLCFSTSLRRGTEVYDFENNMKWRIEPWNEADSIDADDESSSASRTIWQSSMQRMLSLDRDGKIRIWLLWPEDEYDQIEDDGWVTPTRSRSRTPTGSCRSDTRSDTTSTTSCRTATGTDLTSPFASVGESVFNSLD